MQLGFIILSFIIIIVVVDVFKSRHIIITIIITTIGSFDNMVSMKRLGTRNQNRLHNILNRGTTRDVGCRQLVAQGILHDPGGLCLFIYEGITIFGDTLTSV